VNFQLSEQQRMARDTVRDFANERLRAGASARDESGEFPRDLFKELGELGLLGMLVPEQYGGAGMDLLSYLLVIEELARVDASIAVGVSVTNSVCQWPILQFGSEELKTETLPVLTSGRVLGGIMLTEPHAGSDLGSLATKYREESDGFRLSGSKAWITNAGVGQFFLVLARRSPGAKGISAFVLDADQPGVHVHPAEKKMGLKSSATAGVTLEDAFVPRANLLGSEGDGMKVALATLDHSRLGIAAQAIGIAQAALDETLAYTKQREQFGKPLLYHQAVAFRLADMDTELEAARCLLWRALWLAERGGRISRSSAHAKLFASEVANRIVAEAVQLHGGYGFSREFTVERLYRDVRVTTIYEGTSEVQRMVIARALGDLTTTAPE
jgi:hypothetical protein